MLIFYLLCFKIYKYNGKVNACLKNVMYKEVIYRSLIYMIINL